MKNFPVHGQNNYLLLKKLKNQNVAHPRFVVICKIQAIALKWWKQHINKQAISTTQALSLIFRSFDRNKQSFDTKYYSKSSLSQGKSDPNMEIPLQQGHSIILWTQHSCRQLVPAKVMPANFRILPVPAMHLNIYRAHRLIINYLKCCRHRAGNSCRREVNRTRSLH